MPDLRGIIQAYADPSTAEVLQWQVEAEEQGTRDWVPDLAGDKEEDEDEEGEKKGEKAAELFPDKNDV